MLRWTLGCCLMALALTGCSEEADTPAETTGGAGAGPPAEPCEVGETATAAGTCCAAGTLPLEDGSCVEPGIPDDACADGFVASGDGACNAVMPATACTAGEMAIPGDTSCREVMPCGSGPWGDIPVDSATEYVDASFVGSSDGSDTAPWTTIGEALGAVSNGGNIAIAAGSYNESIDATKQVSIRGRCPSMVEIAGGGLATVILRTGGSLLSGVAVSSTSIGVVMAGGADIVVDRVWVHDTGGYGIEVEDTLGAVSATVQGSLVEHAHNAGVIALGGTMTVRETMVRDMEMTSNVGRGIALRKNPSVSNPERATGIVERCAVVNARGVGMSVEISDMTMTGTLVRDTLADGNDEFGRGIEIRGHQTNGEGSNVSVSKCVVEGSSLDGVVVDGSAIEIEHTTVRDTAMEPASGISGTGINLQLGAASSSPAATVRASVVERSTTHGVAALGGVLDMQTTIVRDTMPGQDPAVPGVGIGVSLQDELVTAIRSGASVRGCRIERSAAFGVRAQGSDLLLESTLIVDTLPDGELDFGGGLTAPDSVPTGNRPQLTVRGVVVEQAHYFGMSLQGGDALFENVAIRDVVERVSNQQGGNGLVVTQALAGSNATLSNVLIERALGAGVTVYFSAAALDGVTVREVGAEPASGSLGDGIAAFESDVQIANTRVERAERAGIGAFGARVSLSSSVLECNAIHLNAQSAISDARFADDGGNVCGCDGDTEACRVLSTELEPPTPVDP